MNNEALKEKIEYCFGVFMPKEVAMDDRKQMAMYEAFHSIINHLTTPTSEGREGDADGWKYDYGFLKDLTYKVNQAEHGDGLSMEEVESVLLSVNYSTTQPATPIREGEVLLNCMSCGKEFSGPEPKMCCSGRDCGCMGQPIEPVVCSQECYNTVISKSKSQPVKPGREGGVWVKASDKLPGHDITIPLKIWSPSGFRFAVGCNLPEPDSKYFKVQFIDEPETEDIHKDAVEYLDESQSPSAQIATLEAEVKQLRYWKESAISVMPDMHAIGKELGVKLGASVHDKILPGINNLKADSERYRKALVECKTYFGENDKTVQQHRMYYMVDKILKNKQ